MVLPDIGGTRTDPVVGAQPTASQFGFLEQTDPTFGLEPVWNTQTGVYDPIDPAAVSQQLAGGFAPYLPDAQQQQEAISGLSQQFDQFAAGVDPMLQQQIQEADVRAEATRGQLEQAGLLGLADQFRRARSAASTDAARRGTLGGSFQMGQEVQAQQAAEVGAADVTAQAAQAAEQQRMADLAPVFGFQQQLAGGSPFTDLGRDLFMQDLQQRGQGAQGQFDISQTLENIRSGSEMNRANTINNLLGGIATGAQGAISGYQNQQFLNQMRGLQGGG